MSNYLSKDLIIPYPTTQMVMGEITVEEHIKQAAAALYDEWVCDRRWDTIDIVRLLKMECEKRGAYFPSLEHSGEHTL